jgi:hypothetical protein
VAIVALMAPRIEPSLPEPIEEIIAREMRELRINRTTYFEIAGAFLAGFRTREREDAAELKRLGEWARRAERRFTTIERKLRIPPPESGRSPAQ